MYKIRTSWNKPDSQIAAFSSLQNAKTSADKNPGFFVFDDSTKIAIYPLPYCIDVKKELNVQRTANSNSPKVGKANKGIYTITTVVGRFGFLKSGLGWVDLTNLEVLPSIAAIPTSDNTKLQETSIVIKPAPKKVNYLAEVKRLIPIVYDKINALGCEHSGGAATYAQGQAQKKTTCAYSVSWVLQEAGILKKGDIISHTGAVGGSAENILKKKNTISKAMSGYKNLDLNKCDCIYVGAKNIYDLPLKYRKNGVIMVQDSNIFCCCGEVKGKLTNRSCNNAHGSQLKQDKKGVWRYFNNTSTGGYTFTSPILVVIVPKE